MASWTKRGQNSYRLTVWQGYDDKGKKVPPKQKTITLSEKLTEKQIEKELTLQLDKFEKEVQKGTYLDGNITLNEFSQKWLKDYATIHLRPKTIHNYEQLLKRILPALGHKKLDQIQPTHLIEFYKNLAEGGIRFDYKYKFKDNILSDIPDLKKRISAAKITENTVRQLIKGGNTTKATADKICKALNIPLNKIFTAVDTAKPLSEKSISHYHRLISAMLTTAVQWQLIMANPCERIKPPKVTPKEANYYDIPEVYRLFELLENEPIKYKTMIHIVIFCGLRSGELTNLEWSDIDFENETITVSKQLQYLPGKGIYELDSAKTISGNRTIAIPPMLTDLLREYKTWQDNEKLLIGQRWIELNKLFTQENGKPIFPMTPSKWFNNFIKRNNLPPLTFHQLRHTNISLMVAGGVDIATVGERSGHAKEYVTLRYYTHALKEKNREAANKLQNLIHKKDE